VVKFIRAVCSCVLHSLFFCCFAAAKNKIVIHDLLATTPQDFMHLIQDNSQLDQPVVTYDADRVQQSFLTYYFSPWDHPLAFFSPEALCKQEENKLEKYYKHPGWGPNKCKHTGDFIKSINDNMALATFPNQNQQQPAIVVRTTHLRCVPSMDVSCDLPEKFGIGYPFDKWQKSLLIPNEPLCVLHTSQDRLWNYVVTGNHINGWVQRADIAYVTRNFMTRWKTGKYVTPLCDKLPIQGNTLAPLARVGQLIPLARTQNDAEHYRIFTVASDPRGMATIQVNTVSKANMAIMPLLATPNNMIRLAQSLLGMPYAWGGIEGYRDCSSTLKDLFFPFGIWLPRDSGPQSKSGTFVSLRGLRNDLKAKKIIEQGIPFFSLVWQPGHIMLYAGTKGEKIYVYNNIWGLRTQSLDGEVGRAILGSLVIMPLDFGQECGDIKKTFLDKAEGLILLQARLARPDAELTLFKR